MNRVSVWLFLCVSFLCIIGIKRIDNKIEKIEHNIDFNLPIEGLAQVYDISFNNGMYKIVCKFDELSQGKKTINSSFKVMVYSLDNLDNKGINIGDTIQILGNIKSFSKPKNPGAFNTRTYYFAKKIYFYVYANQLNIIQKDIKGIRKTIRELNYKIEEQTKKIFLNTQAGIINTILIGSKNTLDDDIKHLYKIAGISHLLAISGLHITIIGMGIFKLLKKIINNQKFPIIISICFTWFYCLLSGGSTSSIRAALMFSFMMLSFLFNENYDTISALLISASIIILSNPYQLTDAGFLLSFTAVLGIALLTPKLNKRFNFKNNPIINLFFTSLGASLFTFPIILWFFYELPLYSLIINLLVIPVMSVVIMFSIFAVLISFINLKIGIILGGNVFFILKYIELCCKFNSSLPFNTLTLGRPGITIIILYYFGLLLFIKEEKPRHYLKIKGIFIFIFVLIIMIYLADINHLKISFLDVGQGDAAVIEYKRKVFLIDGGGQAKAKSDKNTGTYVLMPFLASKGISHIDGIFVSHSDFDHIYGIIEVIQKISTDFIVLSKPYENNRDDLVSELLFYAKEKGIDIYYYNEDSHYNYKELDIKCIYPRKKEFNFQNNNAKSLVLNLSYRDFSVLFTGDIEKEQEKVLYYSNHDIVDIIKVPHHGSKTSSSEKFLEKFNPKIAILSYGENNFFGHPSDIVLEQYQKKDIDIFHIANEGAIIITTKGKTFYVNTYYSKRKDKYLCKN